MYKKYRNYLYDIECVILMTFKFKAYDFNTYDIHDYIIKVLYEFKGYDFRPKIKVKYS